MIAEIMLPEGSDYRIEGVVDWEPAGGFEVLALYDSLTTTKPKPDPIAIISIMNISSIHFLDDEPSITFEMDK
jgi:hypothetical protein